MLLEANRRAGASLEPRSGWDLFAGRSSIPRPSKKETAIIAHVRDLAARRGLAVREDLAGNLVIDVPATPGRERATPVVLQAHLDMVCEKDAHVAHDFDAEGIRLVADVDAKTGARIVRADGTTLGADNGLGVALALAAAFSPDVVHGQMEVLLTVDEETGLTGARCLGPDTFRGRRLVNLDTEEDDTITIGCAGGCDTDVTWRFPATPAAPGEEVYRVAVSGLRGGHSGGDIHENRGNAIRLLARLLWAARDSGPRLGPFSGGNKRNAIPREAEAIVAIPAAARAALEAAAEGVRRAAASESNEPDAVVSVERAASGQRFASAADTRRVASGIVGFPCGVIEMHPSLPGLVRTSNNVSTVHSKIEDSTLQVSVGNLSRSSNESSLDDASDRLTAVGELAGATVRHENRYPGWDPDVGSELLASARRVYRELFDADPKVLAVHAGLECGIIGERVGRLEAISIGPTVLGAHSPTERAFVDSLGRAWRYLQALLADLARG